MTQIQAIRYTASFVKPGTPHPDGEEGMVPPGWYVFGWSAGNDEFADTILKVEEARDAEDRDVSESVASRVCATLNAPVAVPGDQLREEIAAALWLIEQSRIPFEQAHPQSQAICRSEADAVLSVVAPPLAKANAGAAPVVDRSTLQRQITAALHTARSRGHRHPDEADTGDLVDSVMGPVDEWDDALHDDLTDEVARLRAELATAREEIDRLNLEIQGHQVSEGYEKGWDHGLNAGIQHVSELVAKATPPRRVA